MRNLRSFSYLNSHFDIHVFTKATTVIVPGGRSISECLKHGTLELIYAGELNQFQSNSSTPYFKKRIAGKELLFNVLHISTMFAGLGDEL